MTDIKIPKGHRLWVTHLDENGIAKYIITSDKTRDGYYLYSIGESGSLKKVAKNKIPIFKIKLN